MSTCLWVIFKVRALKGLVVLQARLFQPCKEMAYRLIQNGQSIGMRFCMQAKFDEKKMS